ncbi:MAG TPA: PAS domain-containing protein [Verrucomicrobiae bacterium]|nr:PAS domain-containing protein [Verrucomicrobiae bacterium]
MENRLIKVLLVEGDLGFARKLRQSLSDLTSVRIDLQTSENLEEALRRLNEQRYDAMLLNLFLPDSRGIGTFARVLSLAPTLPIVILTCCDNETLALEAVREGAQDYVVKSKVDGKILARVIRYAIERKRVERRLAAQHAVTSVLAESTTLNDATPRILQALCESLEWEMGALWKVDAPADVLRCVAVWHMPAAQIPEFEASTRRFTFSQGVGLPGRIWSSGRPVWIANVAEDGNFPRAPVAAKEGLHAAFGFPVKIDLKILGVIEFFSRQIQQPDPDLLRMMAAIGSQIGQFMVRKETEEALAEERNLLRTLIDTLPDAIYVKDTQSRFLLGNAGVARLMGAPGAENLVGKTDFDFFPAELADRYYADDRAVVESGQPLINREEPVLDASGRQGWLLTTKAPLRDTRGQIIGLVGMGREITERKREEERHRLGEARLQAIQLQLIQAEKMESIGTLAAGVAHEVKNPLQTILMGLAYLSKNTPLGDENIPMVLTDMRDAVKRADAIVRDLLSLSASKQLEIEEGDFNAVVQHSLWLVNYELTRSRINVVRDLAAHLPRVRLDKAKMEQVFINLFMNAIQAMPRGGTLTVETSARVLQEAKLLDGRSPGSFSAGDTAAVAEIQDTGIGIPQEKLPRIFEPFFTTKPAGAGTGLGLPVTKQIIDLHGGTIEIRPASGGGVRATIMLKAENGQ